MKKVSGRIQISKWIGNSNKGISIDISDENSGVHIASLDISAEAFAEALFGSDQKCEIELYDTFDTAGKFPIQKTIWVTVHNYFEVNKNQLAKDAAWNYEIDGWKYSTHNIGNRHYAIYEDKVAKYPVYLVKYVNTLEEQKEFENADRTDRTTSIKQRRSFKQV